MSARPISEDDLHAFVDSMLDATREAEISGYLEVHPDVAFRIEAYRKQRLDLRRALDPVVDEPVPSRLSIAHMVETKGPRHSSISRIVAAAAVLLVAGGSGGWLLHGIFQRSSEGIIALAHEASDSYSTYATDTLRPVELRANNSVDLVDWATQRMGRKPALPDLSKSGYRLMGGRVVATPHGAGLMLMYDDDRGTRLVMLTRPMLADQNKTMAPHSEGNVGGWSWALNGMGYSLVGTLPVEMLHPLADEIRRQVSASV